MDEIIEFIFDNLSDEEVGYCDNFLIENIVMKYLFEFDTDKVRYKILSDIKFYLKIRQEEINIML